MAVTRDRVIPLSSALVELADVPQRAAEQGERNPYFFIAGSGISIPAIPTAQGIIEDCRKEALRRKLRPAEPPGESSAELYSYWFRVAHPQPVDRQHYLNKLMKDARVTRATLSLAHLLIDGRLARLVVTPNFDDLLSRSVMLFGHRPVVSDHQLTVGRINPNLEAVQIVHVHGSHRFYDLANLDAEIYDRRQTDSESLPTIPDFLNRLLEDRSPLVIGYAGWPRDVIMMTLRRRLLRTPPRNIYWFCYDEREIARLPEWLTGNQYVYFVIGEPRTLTTAERRAESDVKSVGAAQPADADANPATSELPASRVLSDLIAKLELEAPPLTASPISFFHAQIRREVGDQPAGKDKEDREPDRYVFTEVLRRLQCAFDYENEQTVANESYAKFIDAARRAAHPEIAEIAQTIADQHLSIPQLREIASAVDAAASSALLNKKQRATALLSLDRILGRIADETQAPSDRHRWLKRRIQIALDLYDVDEPDAEIEIYTDIEERFRDSTDPKIRASVISAAGYKANTLSDDRKQHVEALALVESVHPRYCNDQHKVVQDALAELALSRALVLQRTGAGGDEALREIFERYGNSKSYKQQVVAIQSLSHRAQLAYEAGDSEAELGIREQVTAFTSRRPALRLERLRNFREIAATMTLRGDHAQAVTAVDRALVEMGFSDDNDERLIRAQLLRWKARSQFRLGQRAEGIRTACELIEMPCRAWKALFQVVAHGYEYLVEAYLDGVASDRSAAEQLIADVKKARAEDPLLDAQYAELIGSMTAALAGADAGPPDA